MKGITPVIAVILLMLISISMIGFAAIWFTRLAESSQSSVTSGLNSTTSALAKKVRIDNVAGTSLAVRNVGSQTVAPSELSFYVNNVAVTCNITAVQPNAIGACTLSSSCASGATMKVSAPGGSDSVTC